MDVHDAYQQQLRQVLSEPQVSGQLGESALWHGLCTGSHAGDLAQLQSGMLL